jgi:hypothetical protein
MKTNVDSIQNYPTTLPEGTIYLGVDNETATPYNAKLPNYPEDYNRGYAKIRESDGRNTVMEEVGGAEAIKKIYQNTRIHYERDNESNLTGLTPDGYKAFRIIKM